MLRRPVPRSPPTRKSRIGDGSGTSAGDPVAPGLTGLLGESVSPFQLAYSPLPLPPHSLYLPDSTPVPSAHSGPASPATLL